MSIFVWLVSASKAQKWKIRLSYFYHITFKNNYCIKKLMKNTRSNLSTQFNLVVAQLKNSNIFNPFTPNISLVILLTACHTILLVLVLRIKLTNTAENNRKPPQSERDPRNQTVKKFIHFLICSFSSLLTELVSNCKHLLNPG